MSTHKLVDMDEIHAVVGQAVSSLLKSGQTAGIKDIIAFLTHKEAQSVNGQRELYTQAIHIVRSLVN